MKLKISVIVSTYGRYKELDMLLDSLSKQECHIDVFEVIVVDQNDIIDLSPLISSYQNKLNLVHFKSSVKGLSKAKNKGVELAKAEILTFPDDDCTFYPNTISSALDFLDRNTSVDVLYGRVFDRSANKNIMLNWSTKEVRLNLFNYTFNYSAISCFTRLRIKFDENFGVGAEIGLGEELDYVIRAIKQNCRVVYSPDVEVWHPELNVSTMSEKKVYEYSYGYGATMRKNVNIPIFIIFSCSVGLQIFRFVSNIGTNKRVKFFYAIKARLRGFFKLSK